MIDSITVVNEEGKKVKINILVMFKVLEYKKEYIVYTVNDDEKSETVPVFITEMEQTEDGTFRIKLIPEAEKHTVLAFYDNVRDTLIGAN